tara:strand:- start:1778 stop:2026 length:249 start_codon:yes stop_codon:yes gene_type:complete
LWQGVVEYEGENVSYRFYDGHDEQIVYVFIKEQGWVFQSEKHPLIDVIYAAIKEWSCTPNEFGSVGEINEIEEEIVKDYNIK